MTMAEPLGWNVSRDTDFPAIVDLGIMVAT